MSFRAAELVVPPAAAFPSDKPVRNGFNNADTAIQAPAATGSTDSDIRWVTATANTLANLRSDPNREAAIVAVISKDTRVRLGDSRDGWHRVKAGGIDGWVDPRLFSIDEQKGSR